MNDPWTTHRIDVAGEAADLVGREWLLTNGTGAYAMGTVLGVNTRRYHGLFVAATRPPVGRVVVLNQMLERLVLADGTALEFATCRFRDSSGRPIDSPQGSRLLRRFEKGTTATWHYEHRSVRFTRWLNIHWKQQAITLRYRVEGLRGRAVLTLSPMLTLRDFHSLTSRSTSCVFGTDGAADSVTVSRDDVAATFHCPSGRWEDAPDWWYAMVYSIDAERGEADAEDGFVPGRFEVTLDASQAAEVMVSAVLGRRPVEPCPDATARHRHLATMRPAPQFNGQDRRGGAALLIAADDFVVERCVARQQSTTILAGFPWFADWGRDALIAIPGLLLATGRFEEAKATLRTFASSMRGGLVPNRFDDYDDQAAHYNTVDASLWFANVAMQYLHATGDRATWDGWLGDAAREVIDSYLRGTRPDPDRPDGIGVDGDGLVVAGSATSQLTWMDAAIEGVAFTPRHGKAVEINALWYHALVGIGELAVDRDPALCERLRTLAAQVRQSFNDTFWDGSRGALRDHVTIDQEGRTRADAALRPNQIFAVSLPHSPLSTNRQRSVLRVVRQSLLTPFGLRTLPPDDPEYQGRYSGSRFDRDAAYHRGTVWPWLIGPYAEAILRCGGFEPRAKEEARVAVAPLWHFFGGDGLGQLHEIHEGDPPHRPVGCVAQAWSVAELLRVLRLLEG